MPGRFKPRWVSWQPGVTFYKPAGVPARALQIVNITVEELEAIRLTDLNQLTQEQAAKQMNISQPTFNRILTSARQKIADALVNGKAITIEGGRYVVKQGQL